MIRTLRIVLVNGQDLARSGFYTILDVQKDMCVVGQASDDVGVLPMVKATQPDITLVDIRIPILDEISTTHVILGSHPSLKVLILTTFDLDNYLVAVIRAEASGFLLRDSTAYELLVGTRAVARGDSVVAPSVARQLLKRWFASTGPTTGPVGPSEPGTSTAHAEPIDALSDREKEIVTLVGHVMSSTEITRHLAPAKSTIRSYLNRILHKLELRGRAQLIMLAYESGLMCVGK